jgi:hypothetical protein
VDRECASLSIILETVPSGLMGAGAYPMFPSESAVRTPCQPEFLISKTGVLQLKFEDSNSGPNLARCLNGRRWRERRKKAGSKLKMKARQLPPYKAIRYWFFSSAILAKN